MNQLCVLQIRYQSLSLWTCWTKDIDACRYQSIQISFDQIHAGLEGPGDVFVHAFLIPQLPQLNQVALKVADVGKVAAGDC